MIPETFDHMVLSGVRREWRPATAIELAFYDTNDTNDATFCPFAFISKNNS
jgi:hypothetical protein